PATPGAVFDTLAQIHLIRGNYNQADDYLRLASDSYGAYGRETSQWYEWSVRVLQARLALKSGALEEAVRLADDIVSSGAPPFDALQATLIAAEALIAGSQISKAGERLAAVADKLDAPVAPAPPPQYLTFLAAPR